jgi:hypothetical protein
MAVLISRAASRGKPDLMVEIRGNLVGDRMFRDCHASNLHFLVPFIHREFWILDIITGIPQSGSGFASSSV